MKLLFCVCLLCLAIFHPCGAAPLQKEPPVIARPEPALLTSVTDKDLKEFQTSPPAVQKLIQEALHLGTLQLRYLYGSADPANGGVDCSGTIFYLLKQLGLKGVPRNASSFYTWSWKKNLFHCVLSTDPTSFEFEHLRPGDLLFWTGTYDIIRDPPVTHVMLYLGHHNVTNERLMIGASSSRASKGAPQTAVSVTSWHLTKPLAGSTARFVGYGSIPGLRDQPTESSVSLKPDPDKSQPPVSRQTPALPENIVSEPKTDAPAKIQERELTTPADFSK